MQAVTATLGRVHPPVPGGGDTAKAQPLLSPPESPASSEGVSLRDLQGPFQL